MSIIRVGSHIPVLTKTLMSYIPGLYGNEDGVLLQPVEAVCNGIPCPPYDDHKDLSCVVCTK